MTFYTTKPTPANTVITANIPVKEAPKRALTEEELGQEMLAMAKVDANRQKMDRPFSGADFGKVERRRAKSLKYISDNDGVTLMEVSAHVKCSKQISDCDLRKLMEAGKIERKTRCLIVQGSERDCWVYHAL